MFLSKVKFSIGNFLWGFTTVLIPPMILSFTDARGLGIVESSVGLAFLFGSIISIIIVTIFLYIAFRIIKNCINEQEDDIKISLCGLSTILIFQTFIHIGVNTSLLPTTGMTLPFLSYGGSSLLGSAILAGVILNFTKNRYRENEFI